MHKPMRFNKIVHVTVFGILILLILPFVLLCFYCRAQGDDMGVSHAVHELGSWGYLAKVYLTWCGRYGAIAFKAVVFRVPPNWLTDITRCLALASLLAQVMTIALLFKAVSGQRLSVFRALSLGLVVFILYISTLPGLNQGYYWLTGNCAYESGKAGLLLFLAILWPTITRSGFDRWPVRIVLLLLAIFVAGTSEPLVLTMLVVLAFTILYSWRNAAINRWLLIALMCVAIVGALISFGSPGNAIRSSYFPGNHNLYESVARASSATWVSLERWVTEEALWPTTLFALSIGAPLLRIYNPWPRSWFVVNFALLATTCLLVLATYAGCYWSTGNWLPERLESAAYLIFLGGWFACSFIFTGALASNRIKDCLNSRWLLLASCIGVAGTIGTSQNFKTAFRDLTSRVATYDHQWMARENIVRNAKQYQVRDVIVPAFKKVPYSIHFMDITSDPHNWLNVAYAQFYGLKSIRTQD